MQSAMAQWKTGWMLHCMAPWVAAAVCYIAHALIAHVNILGNGQVLVYNF